MSWVQRQHLDLASCHWLLCACSSLQRWRQSAGTDKGKSVCPLHCWPVENSPSVACQDAWLYEEADVNKCASIHIYLKKIQKSGMWFKEIETNPNVQFVLMRCSFTVLNPFLYAQSSNLSCVSFQAVHLNVCSRRISLDSMSCESLPSTSFMKHEDAALQHQTPAEHQL